MIICRKCHIKYDESEFTIKYSRRCRLCYNAYMRLLRAKIKQNNPNVYKDEYKKYASIERERSRNRYHKYKSSIPNFKEKMSAKYKKSYLRKKANDPLYFTEKRAKRRALQKSSVPNWANQKVIKVYYWMARELTKILGIKYSVDHRIPLAKGGLHSQENLQVMTLSENSAKRDRLIYNF